MSHVLIVEDDPVLREALAETMTIAGHTYITAKDGKEALVLLDIHNPGVVLTDIRMDRLDGNQLLNEIQKKRPGLPVILMTAYGSVEDAVIAIRHGAVDYIQKPFSAQALTDKINQYMQASFGEDENDPIAQDPKSQALMSMALKVAQSDVGVMISGESGTGKEVLAHFIHDHSSRKNQPFIAINCAAIPEQMLEATLFGYEKGAFTGAYKSTPGKFEQAQGGTLLLDEVSEMSLMLQAKLLRVLQEKEVERIGSNKMIDLDVRIMATTNRQLKDEVQAGRFREDLFYRLNVFPLQWHPLRERKNDIIPLANYLIRKHCQNKQPIIPVISPAAQKEMLSYQWPGNARELDNVIQRALVLQNQGIIESEHLQLSKIIETSEEDLSKIGIKNLQLHEYELIEKTLTENKGNRQKVASLLGVSERTLRYKLAKMREEGYTV
ncbi:sigma-54-dependent transcriptional regulator [Legionella waltersii]|uniref:Sigma 54-dependent response regulator n=1 Tax=Legionella waltersii TaxID=66969 RepID=A0A0W1AAS4_9GAMM|nr:sigma-54 dependent transcriptional regulator [Legionella waltersii]KTD78411.1 sigma 54-dependent response regulator [Legionella waltersii]SNV06186.1 sigma 54-dependent response regulator [Legionella waltersii]